MTVSAHHTTERKKDKMAIEARMCFLLLACVPHRAYGFQSNEDNDDEEFGNLTDGVSKIFQLAGGHTDMEDDEGSGDIFIPGMFEIIMSFQWA